MNKAQWLKIINPVLLISFLVQAVTGLIIALHLFMSKIQQIFEIHEYNGFALIILAVTHLALNWSWVKATFFAKPKKA